MKRVIFILTLLFAVVAVTESCNKSKKLSKRFMKAGEWHVTTLTVAGVSEAELPHWHIEDCDIYEESCFGEWENEEGGHAEFVWQFREKGNTFEISRQEGEEGHTHDHASEEAAEQCLNFSGVYEVTSSKKDKIELKSSATYGFPGEEVIIVLEKH